MALSASETFDYVVKVRVENGPDSFPWLLDLGEQIEPRGNAIWDDRLVGYSPLLRISDGGVIADSFGLRDEVHLSRFTLSAMNRKNASAREVWFHVDRKLTLLIEAEDELRFNALLHVGDGADAIAERKAGVCGGGNKWPKARQRD